MTYLHPIRSVRPLLLATCVLALACGDEPDETNDGSESTSDTSGDEAESADPDSNSGQDATDPDTTDPDTSGTDTTGPDPTDTDATETSATDTTGDTDATTGEDTTTGGAAGICIGLAQVGNLDYVYAREGANIGGGCDATPAPCGGDVIGTWESTDVCGFEAVPNPLAGQCPQSSFEVLDLQQTGTVTFNDDDTYANDTQSTSQFLLELDSMGCFGVDCGTFETFANMQPGLTVTCAEGGLGCQCSGESVAANMTTGTYAIVGTDLVLTPDGEDPQPPAPYCIAGDRLDLWAPLFQSTPTRESCNDAGDCEAALGDMYDGYQCVENRDGAVMRDGAFEL